MQLLPEHDRLRDRVALVTGGSSGIGRAIARRLVTAGMRVATCARREPRLNELAEELDSDARERYLPICTDLRKETDILNMFARIRKRWGGVDVLINNAGLGHRAPLMSGNVGHWRDMLDINILALCICTREAISDMRLRKRPGHVVHISSMAAHRVPPDSGVYSATKYAVRSLTEALRQELHEAALPASEEIRVSSISPGFVETEFAAHYHRSQDAARQTYGRYPVLQPDDIATAVLYVLSQPPHVQVHDILLRPTDQSG